MNRSALQHAIVLAGGFGTRLKPLVSDRPKPLAQTGDQPFLTRLLAWLEHQGVTSATLAVHHMADQFQIFLDTDYDGGIQVRCAREQNPLGTGGAIKNAYSMTESPSDVLVVNGDTLFAFDAAPFAAVHAQENTGATMVVCEVPNVARFSSITVADARVTSFVQASGEQRKGWSNCGAYLLAPSIIAEMPEGPFSVEKDFFPLLAAEGRLAAHPISSKEAFVDIGTPDSYLKFCETVAQEGHR